MVTEYLPSGLDLLLKLPLQLLFLIINALPFPFSIVTGYCGLLSIGVSTRGSRWEANSFLFLLFLHSKVISVLFSITVIYFNSKALISKILLLLIWKSGKFGGRVYISRRFSRRRPRWEVCKFISVLGAFKNKLCVIIQTQIFITIYNKRE